MLSELNDFLYCGNSFKKICRIIVLGRTVTSNLGNYYVSVMIISSSLICLADGRIANKSYLSTDGTELQMEAYFYILTWKD